MLVAWRVREWVTPILYHTIAISRASSPMLDAFSQYISTKSPQYMKNRCFPSFRNAVHIHNLYIGFLDAYLFEFLHSYPAAKNLYINARIMDRSIALRFADFTPTRLYSTDQFFTLLLAPHPFFSQITHLELIACLDHKVLLKRIPLLPRLTHLSFRDPRLIDISPRLLRTCASLSVLIHLPRAKEIELHRMNGRALTSLSKDFRFVYMPLKAHLGDWLAGARWGTDYWSRAEAFIAKRRAGEIDELQFMLFDDEDLECIEEKDT